MSIHRLAVTAGMLVILSPATVLRAQASTLERPQRFPLTCRGGPGVVFDTLVPRSDTGRVVTLSLTFAANSIAAGAEGQGLQPGTCAWSDRPLTDAEPRRVRFGIHYTDSTPMLTVRDTGLYWSFLIAQQESGHLVGRGYRHWNASSPPHSMALPQRPGPPSRVGWLPFSPRYLPGLLLAWVVIVSVPISVLFGAWSGWRKLARLYPGCDTGRARSFSCGSMVIGLANYRGGVRARADQSHLHFSTWILFRPGHPPFSVPWSEITATPDGWPWFPLKGFPVIRLTFQRYPSLRILVPRKVGERMIAESGGRLQLTEPVGPPLAGRQSFGTSKHQP